MNNAEGVLPQPLSPEKELPTPEKKLLRPLTFWGKYKQVVLLLLLIFVIGGAFIAPSNREQIGVPRPQPKTSHQATSSPSPVLIPTTDLTITADWNTYTNKKYGYTLKYPTNLFSDCSLSDELFALRDGAEACSADGFMVGFAVAVNKRTQESEMTVEDYKKSVDETCYSITTQEMVISGVTATKYYNIIHETDSPQRRRIEVAYILERDEIHIRFEKERFTYLLSFYKNYGKEIENQILSTFKFTD
jgi:hypothetical protein